VPQPVEQQITIIYAATSGGLDDVPTLRVQEFEKLFQQTMQQAQSKVLEEIRTTKQVSDAARAAMDQVVAAVKSQMQLGQPKAEATTGAPKPAAAEKTAGAPAAKPSGGAAKH